ncbi:MAG: aspartate kinase [Candidatus Eremiobacteraeota bacterium]|nr:aspartate kinase [Candidatus Eremiobacteraeota bacterium]
MRIVVMKFGGTSVATPEARQRIVDKVQECRRKGNRPVVVVSAMGRKPSPYATDSLISLVEEFAEYSNIAELDQLMACGETLSAIVVSHTFRKNDIPSRSFDGRQAAIETTEDHGNAKIVYIDPEPLLIYLQTGGVPVVTGFQGVSSHGEVTTLGRGGSDTSAVALGAALKAHFVEIYTDVDGVMTADPRVYSEAEVLEEINFQEMGELASEGAKVIHPRAVEMADVHGVPVWIKNTLTEHPGTYMARAVPRQGYERDRVVSGIAHVFGMTGLVLELSDRGAQVDVLNKFAERGVNLDLINVTERRLYAILTTKSFESSGKALLDELGLEHKFTHGCAKLSIVGAGMRGTPGVMAGMLGSLHDAGVNVIHSTDSDITISVLVPEKDVPAAVSALHNKFLAE